MPASQDPHHYLKAIITKDSRKTAQPVDPGHEPLVVTVSRDYGAGGGEVARRLSDYLGIPLHDQDILDRVAAKAKIASYHLKPHDENVAAGISTFVHSLLTGTGGHLESYRRYLYSVVLDLALNDCVLVGRGAHLILNTRRCYRLRIVGSQEQCAARISSQFDIPLHTAEQRVAEINDKRNKSILSLFGGDHPHPSLHHAANFDLIVNTDHLGVADAMPVILLAMQQSGFRSFQNFDLPE
ncbi:MAG: AAA family ATPase [Methylococcaceae bacterium]